MLELNKVYCIDNVLGMSELNDDSIDLTVTSPPYDKLRNYNGYSWNKDAVIKNLYRITRPGGVVVWVVGDMTENGTETGSSFRQALKFMEEGFNLHDTMIYEKSGFPFPMSNRYYQAFEYMFIFSKGKPKTVNLIQDRKNIYAGSNVAREHGTRIADGTVVENSANKLDKNRKVKEYGVRFNIWKFPTSSSVGDKIALKHPATFPEGLANDHIVTWSNENEIILDPFCGSGTTLKMARLNNRRFIGFDSSQEYCDIANERLTL